MKKTILAMLASSALLMAGNTTITATMSLMSQGLNQVQSGFMHNNAEDVMSGIEVLENANSIFKKVDVSTFIQHNNKVQVTKNINTNLEKNLVQLRKDVEAKKYAAATKLMQKL